MGESATVGVQVGGGEGVCDGKEAAGGAASLIGGTVGSGMEVGGGGRIGSVAAGIETAGASVTEGAGLRNADSLPIRRSLTPRSTKPAPEIIRISARSVNHRGDGFFVTQRRCRTSMIVPAAIKINPDRIQRHGGLKSVAVALVPDDMIGTGIQVGGGEAGETVPAAGGPDLVVRVGVREG